MRVALTGTPGTGKTTVADLVDTDRPVVHLSELVRERGLSAGVDEERDTLVADLAALEDAVPSDALVESHLAHHLEADLIVVLRCHPDVLRERLAGRGWPASKVAENVESERLDLLLSEAVAAHGETAVHEVDTTDRDPAEVAREVEAVLAGEREPNPGSVSFLEP